MESRHKIRALSTEVSASRAVLSYHFDLRGYTAVDSHGVSDSQALQEGALFLVPPPNTPLAPL